MRKLVDKYFGIEILFLVLFKPVINLTNFGLKYYTVIDLLKYIENELLSWFVPIKLR